VVTQALQPLPDLLETTGVVGDMQEMPQFFTGGVDGAECESLVSHVTANIHRQAVEMGLEQILRFDPRPSRGQGGLQFSAVGE
jgi:hypothetical protein